MLSRHSVLFALGPHHVADRLDDDLRLLDLNQVPALLGNPPLANGRESGEFFLHFIPGRPLRPGFGQGDTQLLGSIRLDPLRKDDQWLITERTGRTRLGECLLETHHLVVEGTACVGLIGIGLDRPFDG